MSEEKANQRVEEFKREMKTLTVRLKEAENRAESAEKQVKRLQKEVDRLEGIFIFKFFKNFSEIFIYHRAVIRFTEHKSKKKSLKIQLGCTFFN